VPVVLRLPIGGLHAGPFHSRTSSWFTGVAGLKVSRRRQRSTQAC
jgi:pyruvate/2-oxoglutarate/acetoin dehydrogenase E1 component